MLQLPTRNLHPSKKIVLTQTKNSRAKDFLRDAWLRLKDAVQAIHRSEPISLSLEFLYQDVSSLCGEGEASSLHVRLLDVCAEHVQSYLPRLLEDANTMRPSLFLKHLNYCWTQHCEKMKMVLSIFLPLDRTYALHDSSVESVWDMGLTLFRTHILGEERIVKLCVSGLLQLIEQERLGETIDRSILKSLLSMLLDLKLYYKVFHSEFMKATDTLYNLEAERLSDEMEVSQYLHHVSKRINDENSRLSGYLDVHSRPALMKCLDQQLLQKHLTKLLDNGLAELFNEERLEDLSLLYRLYSRCEEGPLLVCDRFGEYVKKGGLEIVLNPEKFPGKDKEMVQRLLDYKERMDRVVRECFQNKEKMWLKLRDCFESFINQRQHKPSELIAKYVDARLRPGNRETTEEELEAIFDRILVLFRFIQGKDIFEVFYKKDLAKRLLVNKSSSVDSEKSMLSRLKQECGCAFTTKLEGMFRDMDVSAELTQSFRQYLTSQRPLSGALDMSVCVLTMGFWPTYQPVTVNLPVQLKEHQELFTQFYASKHSGRTLTWQANLGHCILKSYFGPKFDQRKEIQVSVFQALCLLAFNNALELSYAELLEITNIEAEELKRTLQSLSLGKARVLLKTPKGKEVGEKDRFLFNQTFKSAHFRLRINQVQLKETKEEQKETQERVFQDRQYQIDAAIVRIMKMRKSLTHTQLMTQLMSMLRFPSKASDLKKRIESLIEREYLERDKENASLYNYMA